MIRGVIFDFDGLMVDTESPAFESWQEIYREYGTDLPLSLWAAVLGGSGLEFDPCTYLEEQSGRCLDYDAIRTRRWQRKLELTAAQPLLPGVADYITTARRLNLKLGVASSSSRKWVVGHLHRLGVSRLFDAIICADNVAHVKPDPEIYQMALAALDLQPEETIALEDAPYGLLSAKTGRALLRGGAEPAHGPAPPRSRRPAAHVAGRRAAGNTARYSTGACIREKALPSVLACKASAAASDHGCE